ncbi:MAG: hypothetical protein DI534_13900 [Leifsonia xyli]|nr:MAG: hypothetical protein DI534_13900 [Leifsonia xyli]
MTFSAATLLLAVPMAIGAAAAASAAPITVTSWSDLTTAAATGGATITLGGDILAADSAGGSLPFGPGVSSLDLNGHTLEITSPPGSAAAVGVPTGVSLTILDSVGGGALTATSDSIGGAAIGGPSFGNRDAGTVRIEGGTVTATSGLSAAIGGGSGTGATAGSGGTLIVTGGTVTATSQNGAGIGGGLGNGAAGGAGGTLTVTGGTVTATSAVGAGIGGGSGNGAAGGAGGSVNVSGGTVTASTSGSGAGIGGGSGNGAVGGDGGTVVISGGTVTARSTYNAGVGGGFGNGSTGGQGAAVTLTGGRLTATGATGVGGGGGANVGSPGLFDVHATAAPGAATDGNGPTAAAITSSVTPAGLVYRAVASAVGSAFRIEVSFAYLVTFDSTGGSVVAPQIVDPGSLASRPSDPTRAGAVFAGWTAGEVAYDFSTPATAPLTLTANWTTTTPATAELPATGPGDTATGILLGMLLLSAGVVARATLGRSRRIRSSR